MDHRRWKFVYGNDYQKFNLVLEGKLNGWLAMEHLVNAKKLLPLSACIDAAWPDFLGYSATNDGLCAGESAGFVATGLC